MDRPLPDLLQDTAGRAAKRRRVRLNDVPRGRGVLAEDALAALEAWPMHNSLEEILALYSDELGDLGREIETGDALLAPFDAASELVRAFGRTNGKNETRDDPVFPQWNRDALPPQPPARTTDRGDDGDDDGSTSVALFNFATMDRPSIDRVKDD